MKDPIYINCATKADRLAAITMLLGMGLKWHGEDGWIAKKVDERFSYETYPTLKCQFENGKWQISGTSYKNQHEGVSTLGEAYVKLDKAMNAPKPVEVKLNDKYTAKITEDGVVVGCQTFAFEAIADLHTAIVKFWEE